ncbi:TauD/TfdA dioxygenase family protein [Minwuia sp.]|uniref:TauD/TfdA dioxygenase family protein n=1 Tax=Minwuia sp. TaxID=2493630 RepID=UPI003A912AEF
MTSHFHAAPLHEEFGTTLTGIDLKAPLSAPQIEAIRVAIDEHSFVCFPDQFLDDDQQLAFTRLLGEPEPNHVILGQTGQVNYFGSIGNVDENGVRHGNMAKGVVFQTGNNMWHTDSSFRKVPSMVSIMSVHEVPDEGGETLFVSARAAYDRLSDAEKQEIDPLIAIHDYVFSRSKVAPDAVTPEHAASLPPVPQKLVRRNPRNGRANYYVGSHAKVIDGWDEARSRALLDDLLARATGPAHILTHRWQPGELVIWDNRCLLHRGAGYDADRYRRYMRQTRVTGAGPTPDE